MEPRQKSCSSSQSIVGPSIATPLPDMPPFLEQDLEKGCSDPQSDSELVRRPSIFYPDDFDEVWNESRVVRTGRQRKKLAARSKGGEFQAKRKKRRVNFACISEEINLRKLQLHLDSKESQLTPPEAPWQYTYTNDVLRLFRAGPIPKPIQPQPPQP